MVLYFEQPFADVDDALGLTRSAQIRMQSAEPTDDIHVLVTKGFENISSDDVARLADLKYRIVDASAAFAAVKRKYPFANDSRIWRGETFHEMCFLRWLVLEEYFGGAGILAMDSDIVWRVDPHSLAETFSDGGSSLCMHSCCMVFIKDRQWFEAYRSGLERLSTDPTFGAEFKRDHFTGLYHDQALLQHLWLLGDIESDATNMLHRGLSDRYFISSNPIGITAPAGTSGLTFEQTPTSDRIGGKLVPFWHMQSRFSRYLWAARFAPVFTNRPDVRIPYENYASADPNLAVLMLNNLHQFVRTEKVMLRHKAFLPFKAMTSRAGIYEEFFSKGLASEIFTDRKWWKPGVWAQ